MFTLRLSELSLKEFNEYVRGKVFKLVKDEIKRVFPRVRRKNIDFLIWNVNFQDGFFFETFIIDMFPREAILVKGMSLQVRVEIYQRKDNGKIRCKVEFSLVGEYQDW